MIRLSTRSNPVPSRTSASRHGLTASNRDVFATVTEDKAMAEVQDWFFPRPIGRLSLLARRVSAWLG